MLQWRAKIGIIKPNYNGKTLKSWFELAPEGVEIAPATLGLPFGAANTSTDFADLPDTAERLAVALAESRCDAVVVTGVPLVSARGARFEYEWRERLQERLQVPIVTPFEPYLEAVRALGAGRVGFATYFTDDVNADLPKVAAEFGLDSVVLPSWAKTATASDAMVMAHDESNRVGYEDVYRFCRAGVRSLREPIEALAIVGGLYSAPAIALLEADLGIPVVNGDTSQHWSCYRRLGIALHSDHYGRLLRNTAELPPAPPADPNRSYGSEAAY